MRIEKKFVRNPGNIIHCIISLMQKWSGLLQPKDRERLDSQKGMLETWAKSMEYLNANEAESLCFDQASKACRQARMTG